MTQNVDLAPFGAPGMQLEYVASGGTVRRVVGASSAATLLATDTNARYVDPGGNDATGDGSRSNPYRTVQPAIAACVAAGASAANAFAVRVSPGAGFGTFKLATGVYVVGSGSGPSDFNATLAQGVTVLNPDPAQLLDASFAGAANTVGGIIGAALSSAVLADFAAIASTGSGRILLRDLMTQSAITVKGGNTNNAASLEDITLNNTVALTVQDMGSADLYGIMSDFGGTFVFTQTAAWEGFYQCAGSNCDHLVVTTPAGSSNRMVLSFADFTFNNSTISGSGSNVIGGLSHAQVMSDANNTLGFGFNAAATMIGISMGLNVIECTPTANRTLTIDRPIGASTTTPFVVRNLSTAFNIDLAFSSGTVAAGSPTYVPPGGEVRITFNNALAAAQWMVQPYAQYFELALTNGVSASTPADVTARTGVGLGVTAVNASTALGQLTVALTVGTRAGAGRIQITSKIAATLATQVADQSTVGVVLSG